MFRLVSLACIFRFVMSDSYYADLYFPIRSFRFVFPDLYVSDFIYRVVFSDLYFPISNCSICNFAMCISRFVLNDVCFLVVFPDLYFRLLFHDLYSLLCMYFYVLIIRAALIEEPRTGI